MPTHSRLEVRARRRVKQPAPTGVLGARRARDERRAGAANADPGSSRRDAGSPGARTLARLARDAEVRSAVARPAGLGSLLAQWHFLAVGDGLQPVGRDAELHEVVVGRLGAALA